MQIRVKKIIAMQGYVTHTPYIIIKRLKIKIAISAVQPVGVKVLMYMLLHACTWTSQTTTKGIGNGTTSIEQVL